MARVVAHGAREIPEADPARVWALVADPVRIGEWAPLRVVGHMGTELPAVGHAFFANWRRASPDERAVRFEFVEWVAGRSYRCAMSPAAGVEDREIEVRVHSVVESAGATTRVEIRHRAETGRWLAPGYRLLATRRIERALDSIVNIVMRR